MIAVESVAGLALIFALLAVLAVLVLMPLDGRQEGRQ